MPLNIFDLLQQGNQIGQSAVKFTGRPFNLTPLTQQPAPQLPQNLGTNQIGTSQPLGGKTGIPGIQQPIGGNVGTTSQPTSPFVSNVPSGGFYNTATGQFTPAPGQQNLGQNTLPGVSNQLGGQNVPPLTLNTPQGQNLAPGGQPGGFGVGQIQNMFGQLGITDPNQVKQLLGLVPGPGQQFAFQQAFEAYPRLLQLQQQLAQARIPSEEQVNVDKLIAETQQSLIGLNPRRYFQTHPGLADTGVTESFLERQVAREREPLSETLANFMLSKSVLGEQQQRNVQIAQAGFEAQQQLQAAQALGALFPQAKLPEPVQAEIFKTGFGLNAVPAIQEYNQALQQGLIPQGTNFQEAQILLHPENRFIEKQFVNPLTGMPETQTIDKLALLRGGIGGQPKIQGQRSTNAQLTGAGQPVEGKTLEDRLFGSATYTTDLGNKFLRLDEFQGNQRLFAMNWAAQNGIKMLNKDQYEQINEIDHVRSQLKDQLNILSPYLPGGGLSRLVEAPFNIGAAFGQFGERGAALAGYDSFRVNAIATIRSVGGAKGLRVTQSELASAINSVPKKTDSLPTAETKINNLTKTLNDWEQRAAGKSVTQRAPSPNMPTPTLTGLFPTAQAQSTAQTILNKYGIK